MAIGSGTKGMQTAADKLKPRTGNSDGEKSGKAKNRSRKKTAVKASKMEVEPAMNPELQARMTKYERVSQMSNKQQSKAKSKGGRLRNAMDKMNSFAKEAAEKAARSEMLLTEEAGYLEAEGMEKTFKFTQEQIRNNLDLANIYIEMDTFGPYTLDYARNGRHLLIGGRRGHVAAFDWRAGKLGCELHLRETVRDVSWLHNETMFAVAQKKHVYIYDHTGLEIHCLKKHGDVRKLDFLPYHFLLTSINESGYLKYHDTSTGQLIAEINTGLGQCDVMAQNPYNAVIHLGHAQGKRCNIMESNVTSPLVKMQCHKGPITALAVQHSGYYMATTGLDGQLKIGIFPASSLDISQMGLLAVGYNNTILCIPDEATSPYMNHTMPRQTVNDLQFCPYDDVLGYGSTEGISSVIVPGSGEPNFDKKIQPDLIMLEPNFIGRVDRKPQALVDQERLTSLMEAHHDKKDVKNRKRGRNSATKRQMRRVKKNIIDERRLTIEERLQREKEERANRRKDADHADKEPTALDQFYAVKNKRSRVR
ncbi:WD40-repeat-containing domain protein [Syncephalis plumigaleata]|nr:WD40-repeat-containing domain protein [Syncephalis plumigaleata]